MNKLMLEGLGFLSSVTPLNPSFINIIDVNQQADLDELNHLKSVVKLYNHVALSTCIVRTPTVSYRITSIRKTNFGNINPGGRPNKLENRTSSKGGLKDSGGGGNLCFKRIL